MRFCAILSENGDRLSERNVICVRKRRILSGFLAALYSTVCMGTALPVIAAAPESSVEEYIDNDIVYTCDSTKKTAYVDKTAQPNTAYEYAVSAYKEVDEDIIWSAAKSDSYSFTTGDGAKKKVSDPTYEDDDEDDTSDEEDEYVDEEDEEEEEEEEDTSSSAPDLML